MCIIWSHWESKWLASCRTNPIIAQFCKICISWSTHRKEWYSNIYLTFTPPFLRRWHRRWVAQMPAAKCWPGQWAQCDSCGSTLFWAAVSSHKVQARIPTHGSTYQSYFQTNQDYTSLKLSCLYQSKKTNKVCGILSYWGCKTWILYARFLLNNPWRAGT